MDVFVCIMSDCTHRNDQVITLWGYSKKRKELRVWNPLLIFVIDLTHDRSDNSKFHSAPNPVINGQGKSYAYTQLN